jgi:hypothetical protein
MAAYESVEDVTLDYSTMGDRVRFKSPPGEPAPKSKKGHPAAALRFT